MAGDRALAVPTQDEHCPQPCQGRWPRCGPISCLDPADSRPSLPSTCATWDRDQPSDAGSHGSEEERVVGASGGRAATTVCRAARGLSTRPQWTSPKAGLVLKASGHHHPNTSHQEPRGPTFFQQTPPWAQGPFLPSPLQCEGPS